MDQLGKFLLAGSYKTNIRGILERRLSQILRFDEALFHMVERAIEDLPSHPDVSLSNFSHVEDKALDLIWTRELADGHCIGAEIVSYWTQSPRDKHKIVREMMDADHWEVPADRSRQLGLLQLLTGSYQDFTKTTATYTSKDSYVLLNAIHSFRNRTQHSGGQSIHLGTAVSALMLCIELLACLARETP
jgi:hypothetical protein